MAHRVETDFLGSASVPDEAYYGAFTARALETFKLSPYKAPPRLIEAILLIKKASAATNVEEGLLDKKKADAINKAADEALLGKFDQYFQLDAFQAGAGTPYNMNVNEVLANRATELLGGKKGRYTINPNNDVNCSQSSNDVIPTAVKLACLLELPKLDMQAKKLENSLAKKAKQFNTTVKPARTHLQDAVPMTLGQQLQSYASAIKRSRARIAAAGETLKEIHLGGTAAGTGINTTPLYREKVSENLAKLTGIAFAPTDDPVELTQNHNDFLHFAQALTLLSVDLTRICVNLKLLSSGPKTGFAEIILPEVEPGSSIMPGKVNPSVVEAVEMCAMHALGSMHSVELACVNTQLDLNSNTPLIAFELLNSMRLLENALCALSEKCVDGIKANSQKMKEYVEESHITATALNPALGYGPTSKLVKEALKTGKTLREVVLAKKLLAKGQLDSLLKPESLTRPNLKPESPAKANLKPAAHGKK